MNNLSFVFEILNFVLLLLKKRRIKNFRRQIYKVICKHSCYRVNINLKLTPKLVDETGNDEEISGVLI